MRCAILFTVDDRYFPIAATQALRPLALSGPELAAHVFVDGSPPSPARIDDLEARGGGRLRVHVNKLLQHVPRDVPAGLTGSRIVYGRLFAGQYIDADRLLYVDVDVGIEDTIDPLLGVDMRAATIAAVFDAGLAYEADSLSGDSNDNDLANVSTFNAGVILFDRTRWLARDVNGNLKRWACINPHALFADQAFLNESEDGRWLALSPRWNCQGPLIEAGLETAIRPHILHFTGGWKPWHPAQLAWHKRHAEAFMSRAASAGFSREDFVSLHRHKRSARWKPITSGMSRALYALGVRTPLTRARQDAFAARARFYTTYLRKAEACGFFADPFELGIAPLPRPMFDGRHFHHGSEEVDQ